MNSSLSRIEFFNGYFKLLELKEIESVILHTYLNYPEIIHSDIDYCVPDSALDQIIPLLYEYCVSSGWRLVQIMQHEVKAFFCTCVSIDEPNCYIQLDVCSHYMREGKFLMSAKDLLRERSQPEDKMFYVPSNAAEFCYSVCKGIAKDKLFSEVEQKLKEIYDSDPAACQELMIYCGILGNGLSFENWSKSGELVYKAMRSKYLKLSNKYPLQNFLRQIRRIVSPSGIMVNCSEKLSEERAEGLTLTLEQLFRNVVRVDSKLGIIKELNLVLRSSAVVSVNKKIGIRSLPDKLMNFWVDVDSKNQQKLREDIYKYLEARLVKKWRISSVCK